MQVVPVHTMKAYSGQEVKLQSALISGAEGGEWRALYPSHLIPLGKWSQYPLNRRLGRPQSQYGPLVKRKISFSCHKLNHDSAVTHSVA